MPPKATIRTLHVALERPVEPPQPAGGGVAGDAGVDDLELVAVVVDLALQQRRIGLLLEQPEPGRQAVAEARRSAAAPAARRDRRASPATARFARRCAAADSRRRSFRQPAAAQTSARNRPSRAARRSSSMFNHRRDGPAARVRRPKLGSGCRRRPRPSSWRLREARGSGLSPRPATDGRAPPAAVERGNRCSSIWRCAGADARLRSLSARARPSSSALRRSRVASVLRRSATGPRRSRRARIFLLRFDRLRFPSACHTHDYRPSIGAACLRTPGTIRASSGLSLGQDTLSVSPALHLARSSNGAGRGMAATKDVVRIAAIGDLHYSRTAPPARCSRCSRRSPRPPTSSCSAAT